MPGIRRPIRYIEAPVDGALARAEDDGVETDTRCPPQKGMVNALGFIKSLADEGWAPFPADAHLYPLKVKS